MCSSSKWGRLLFRNHLATFVDIKTHEWSQGCKHNSLVILNSGYNPICTRPKTPQHQCHFIDESMVMEVVLFTAHKSNWAKRCILLIFWGKYYVHTGSIFGWLQIPTSPYYINYKNTKSLIPTKDLPEINILVKRQKGILVVNYNPFPEGMLSHFYGNMYRTFWIRMINLLILSFCLLSLWTLRISVR